MKSSNQCNKEILSKLARDEPNLLTNEFLLESQAYVRFRLDEKIDTSCMLSKLPVIRRRRLLNFHFKQATGENIDVFRKYFSAKRDKIIRYSLTCKAGTHLEDTSSDTDILRFLCTLTGEKFDDLVHLKEVSFHYFIYSFLQDLSYFRLEPVLIVLPLVVQDLCWSQLVSFLLQLSCNHKDLTTQVRFALHSNNL